MHYLILGLMTLAFFLWASKKIVRANPATAARYARTIGGVALVSFAGLLTMRGALAIAGPLALFGFGLLNGGFSFGRSKKTQGQRSKVNSEFLELELDHDSGDMRGFVLKGAYRGRSLVDLDLEQLLELRGECQSDPQSAQLMDGYLDRTEADWRERAGFGQGGAGEASGGASGTSGPGGATGTMTIDEALDVLGLEVGVSVDDIHQAHRDLMKKNHPDQGGSTYLAAKINEAKDVLLG